MQHIHMSTGFALVLALFIIGILAVIFAFIVSIRRDNRERRISAEMRRLDYTSGPYASPSNPRAGDNVFPSRASGYAAPPQAAAAAPVTVMHNGGGTDLLTGMMVGSMLSNHGHGGGFGGGGNTTIINEAPAYDSGGGFSYESGGDSGGGCDFGGGD